MKLHTSPRPIYSRCRRTFLKGLGTLGAGSLFFPTAANAGSARYAQHFQLSAEGTVTDFSLVWPTPQVPPLPDGLILRIRINFPIGGRDILEWQTFVAAASAPEEALQMVTFFHLQVDAIALSETPAPNFGIFGQVIDNPVVDNPNHSPFGDLTGRVGMVYGQFDAPGENITFTLLGGAAAGSHASAVPTGTGFLRTKGSWRSLP